MSEITIKEVVTNSDIKTFVNLQFEIYKGNDFWVPPMKKDEMKSLMPSENPAFDFCDAKFWLAFKEGKCVGRIGGIINKKYNEKTGNKEGRFTRLEFIDDKQVSKKLLETAEKWVKEQAMDVVLGPLGFINLDHQAMLVDGFDHLPSVASEYHLPYYQEHMDAHGYSKELDWVEFRLTIGDIPPKVKKLNKIIQERYKLRVISFTKQAELKPYADKVFELLNKAFSDLFSVVQLDKKMIDFVTQKYFSILNPKFVKVVERLEDGEIAGFIVGLPSLSKAMQKANGKLFPFGFWHIMKALKNPTEVDLLLTGIDPEYQRQGVPALLISELQQVMLDHGVKHVETTGIIETNQKAIATWKNYEHIQHKRKRCYRKELNA